MMRTLAAGTAVTLFVIALVAFVLGADRIAGIAFLGGMVGLSVTLLVHVSDRRNG